MSPHLGQGVNLALEDARRLAEAIEQCPTPQAAMRQYAEQRAWSIRYYATVTAGLSPFFQGDGSLLGRARNIGLPILCRFGPTRQLMLRTLCGVG
jgi:2-polyprenyl-6-methoxyphenol hydroxylase-like FAD-dependent oxidoreductase